MSFLTNAKDLAEAKAKISALELTAADAKASIERLTSERDSALASLAELKSHISADESAAKELVSANEALAAQLAAEKLAHDATKASVEKLASEKAQHTLASVGQPPVPAAPVPQTGGVEFLDRMAAEPDPVKRAQLWEQNKKQARAAFIPSKRN